MTKEEFFTRYTFNRDTDRLGAGSFGTVFRAYDTVLDRWVALKISPAAGDSMRLSREVELVKGLPEHPNVAGYEDCFTFAEYPNSLFSLWPLGFSHTQSPVFQLPKRQKPGNPHATF